MVKQELLSQKTENGKVFDLGEGKRQLVVSMGAVHYKDDYSNKSEPWKDIDLTWEGNRITKAPYELTREGNKLTIRNKKTSEVSTIELLSSDTLDTDIEITARNRSVSFTRILRSDKASREAQFRVTGNFRVSARDEDGELPVETTLKDGILTETLKPDRPIKYPVRIDPSWFIGASTDDCWFLWSNASVWHIDLAIIFQYGGNTNVNQLKQGGGLRFTSIAIPQGSTINSAFLTFVCGQAYATDDCNTRITGEATDDAATWSTVANYQGRRGTVVGGATNNNITVAQVDWDAIETWVLGNSYNSPDFKAVIEEITDRGGWASGQDLALWWDDHDGRSDAAARRMAASWDHATLAAPELTITFTPPIDPPTVTTQAASSVEDTTATGNVTITDNGGENCDFRGIAWDTVSRGDPGALSPAASAYANYSTQGPGAYGVGAFTRSMTGLPTNDIIYARGYAHNSAGWNWGGEVSFLTKPTAPTGVVATDNLSNKVTITWNRPDGAPNYRVYRGAVNVGGLLGNVGTYDDTGGDAPTIVPGNSVASDGTSTAHVALSLTGTSVADGATYAYKVVAVNATGNSDDSNTDNGHRDAAPLTYQWQYQGWANLAGATGATHNDTTAPAPTITPGNAVASDGGSTAHVALSLAGTSTSVGATRNYRCILYSANASNTGVTSAENTGYRSVGALGYQWRRSAGDADNTFGNIGGATASTYNDVDAPAPTITPGNAGATKDEPSHRLYVALTLAGESTSEGDGRWYYCQLTAAGAAGQDSGHNRGYRGVGALTHQWQMSPTDADAGHANIPGATTEPYNATEAPGNGHGRWFRCVENADGAAQQISSTNRGFRWIPDQPNTKYGMVAGGGL